MAKELKENMRIMFYQIKNINEEIKIIKWNQTEILALKTTKPGMKNSIEGLNCRTLSCMHLPDLSCSGSGTRVVLKGADSVEPAFCALPRSEKLRWCVWRACSLWLIASSVPATRFSGCTMSAPSQAGVDRPESQEVLVTKEACLQFGR